MENREKSEADEFAGKEGKREISKVTTNDLTFPRGKKEMAFV